MSRLPGHESRVAGDPTELELGGRAEERRYARRRTLAFVADQLPEAA